MTDKKKVGLEYYGELWTAPGRTYGLYGDFNQYALGITTGDKHPVTKYLYITHLSEVFVRLRDIIVAEARVLDAIERLTGDSKMARIAGGLDGTELRGRNHD